MIGTDKGRVWITFNNGYTISIINGYGSYSENRYKSELIATPEFASIDSKDCEVAIVYKGEFVTNDFLNCGDSVKGYVRPDELAEIILMVKNKD